LIVKVLNITDVSKSNPLTKLWIQTDRT